MPKHLLAEEKHIHSSREKAYVATTITKDCVLGASVSLGADEEDLIEAYIHLNSVEKEFRA